MSGGVDTFELIGLKKIKEGTNYRRSCGEDGLKELADSIRQKGVLQPVIVRRNGKAGTFELVAGFRRYRACGQAGLKEIPAIVKDLTDADVVEIQVIENTQREDPNVMDEAEGFKRLLDLGRHTVDTLAEKIGKGRTYILTRLRLVDLPEYIKRELAGARLQFGHALLLSRLGNDGQRKEMLKEIQEEDLSVRQAQNEIKNYLKTLGKAAFDTSTCDDCAYLSRNQAELFPELKTQTECGDSKCFQKKTLEHYKARAEGYREQGFRIITSEKEVGNLRHGRNSTAICAPGADTHETKPKRYKSECMKCTEHHAFYLYEQDRWGNKSVEAGELCLNKRCLQAMNNPKRAEQGSGAQDGGEPEKPGLNPYTLRAHAKTCRDRFLRAEIPARLAVKDDAGDVLRITTLTSRLTIHALLMRLTLMGNERWREILKQFSKRPPGAWVGETEMYRHVLTVEFEDLNRMEKACIEATIGEIDGDVLALAAPETGIDMGKDFGPDETYLKTLTKDDLANYAKDQGLEIDRKATAKKGTLVDAILAHDLKGKHNHYLTEALKLQDRSAELDDIEDEPCSR